MPNKPLPIVSKELEDALRETGFYSEEPQQEAAALVSGKPLPIVGSDLADALRETGFDFEGIQVIEPQISKEERQHQYNSLKTPEDQKKQPSIRNALPKGVADEIDSAMATINDPNLSREQRDAAYGLLQLYQQQYGVLQANKDDPWARSVSEQAEAYDMSKNLPKHGGLRALEVGVGRGVNSIASLAARFVSRDTADWLERKADVASQARQMKDQEQFADPYTLNVLSSTVESATQMAPGIAAGGAGLASKAPTVAKYAQLIPALFGGTVTGNRSIYEGRKAGLSGWKLGAYAAGHGAAEALFEAIPLLKGLGAESRMLRENVAKGMKEAAKMFAKDFGVEQAGEQLTSLTQATIDAISGVDPEALTPERILQLIKETAISTAALSGMVGGAGAIGDRVVARQQAKILLTEEGARYFAQVNPEIAAKIATMENPTRADLKAAGLDIHANAGERAQIAQLAREAEKQTPPIERFNIEARISESIIHKRKKNKGGEQEGVRHVKWYPGMLEGNAAYHEAVEISAKNDPKVSGLRMFIVGTDIMNLGGLNTKFGSNEVVNTEAFAPMIKIMEEHLAATGAKVTPIKSGGDEVSFHIAAPVTMNPQALQDAAKAGEAAVAAWVEEQGLSEIEHQKHPDPDRLLQDIETARLDYLTNRGTGVRVGIKEVEPGDTGLSVDKLIGKQHDAAKEERHHVVGELLKQNRTNASEGQPGSANEDLRGMGQGRSQEASGLGKEDSGSDSLPQSQRPSGVTQDKAYVQATGNISDNPTGRDGGTAQIIRPGEVGGAPGVRTDGSVRPPENGNAAGGTVQGSAEGKVVTPTNANPHPVDSELDKIQKEILSDSGTDSDADVESFRLPPEQYPYTVTPKRKNLIDEGLKKLERLRKTFANDPIALKRIDRVQAQLESGALENNAVFARPDLANPATDSGARDLVDRVDERRTREGRPEPRSDEEVKKEADSLLRKDYSGVRDKIIRAAREGRPGDLTDAEIVAAKQIVNREASDAIRRGDEAAIQDAMDLINAYRDVGAEQARAFRQRRDPVESPEQRRERLIVEALLTPNEKSKKAIKEAEEDGNRALADQERKKWAGEVKKLRGLLQEAGVDPDNLGDVAKDPQKACDALRTIQAAKADTWDAAYEFWRNSILSAPQTHIVNVVGNTAHTIWHFTAERFVEALINYNGWDPKGARIGEYKHVLAGVLPGISRGLRNALQAWRTEMPVFMHGDKYDTPNVAISGKKGRVVRVPQRLLMSADEFAKTMITEMDVGAQAYRIAKAEGLSGNALSARMADLHANLNSEAWARSIDLALKLTFQEKMGPLGQSMLKFRSDAPGIRWILPFITTPYNVFKTGVIKSPIGMVSLPSKIAKAVKTGNYGHVSTYAAQQTIAWGIMLALYGLFGEDDEKAIITGTGDTLHPQSIRIGNTWLSYRRIEPFGTVLSLMADSAIAFRKGGTTELLSAPFASLIKQAKDKTFIGGIGDIMRVIESSSRNGGEGLRTSLAEWASQFASSWMPNFVRSGARAARGYSPEYAVWGKGEEWQRRIMRRTAEGAGILEPKPRYDLWGRKREYGESPLPGTDFAWRLLSPVYTSKADVFVGDRILMNWNRDHPEKEYRPKQPAKQFVHQGKRYSFTDAEYAEYCRESGSFARKKVENSISASSANKPTERHIKFIESAIRDGRKYAKLQIILNRRKEGKL